MGTVLEEYPTKEQHSVVRFSVGKRIFIQKYFLFMVRSVCYVKCFTTGPRNSLKDIQKLQMMFAQVQMWLRQQSKDFCAVGFIAMVKGWDKNINVGGGMLRNRCFSRFKYHSVLCFISICDLFTDSTSYVHFCTHLKHNFLNIIHSDNFH